MSDQRGFHRVIEAGKGLKRFLDWLERGEDAAVLEDAKPTPKACKRPQASGWRCTRTGKHTQCLLEQVK